ncbi:MAG TPA: hypothetical protein VIS73_03540, partial [Rhodocyclaceae bacterium]
PGSERDFEPGMAAVEPPPAPLTPAQRKHRLELMAFRKSFADFPAGAPRSRVAIDDLKRGDVLRIRTIVGNVFLRIVDRIREHGSHAGEILCECHYDLGGQCNPAHAASVTLPICSKDQVITGADGTQRQASRKLKIRSETELPPQLGKLLDERFFLELVIYGNPQAEKLRPVDVWRAVARILLKAARLVWRGLLKIKALIDENNRREREKKEQKAAAQRQRQEAKKAAREARRKPD